MYCTPEGGRNIMVLGDDLDDILRNPVESHESSWLNFGMFGDCGFLYKFGTWVLGCWSFLFSLVLFYFHDLGVWPCKRWAFLSLLLLFFDVWFIGFMVHFRLLDFRYCFFSRVIYCYFMYVFCYIYTPFPARVDRFLALSAAGHAKRPLVHHGASLGPGRAP